jgi:hypothetical protein
MRRESKQVRQVQKVVAEQNGGWGTNELRGWRNAVLVKLNMFMRLPAMRR